MMQFAPSVVGMVYEGEPFDAHTWSGCSPFFFRALEREGMLRTVFGAQLTPVQAQLLRIAAIHPNIDTWKFREGVNVVRRNLRTQDGLRKLAAIDPSSYDTILQIGALYDFTRVPGKRTVSYNDTNLQAMVAAFPERADPRSPMIRAALSYEARLAQKTDLIFTMSKWAADTFVRDVGVRASKVEPIGAGINLDEVPAPAQKRYDAQNVLFVGRDFSRKGGYTLLDAFERVRRAVPQATLTIIGPKGLRDIPAGVTSLGFVSKRTESGSRQIREAYERASVFALPSLWEPFGIAILEAQMHALPCVGTRVGAMTEMIETPGAGCVVAPRDAGALANALIDLLKDPLACRQLGEAGRRNQQQYYRWQHVARRIRERLLLDETAL